MMLQPDNGPKVEPTIAVRRSLLVAMLDLLPVNPNHAWIHREVADLLEPTETTNDGKGTGAGDVPWRAE